MTKKRHTIPVSPACKGFVNDSEPRSELLKYLDHYIYMHENIHETEPAILLDRIKQIIHYKPIFSDEQHLYLDAKAKLYAKPTRPQEFEEFHRDWCKTYPASTLPAKYRDES